MAIAEDAITSISEESQMTARLLYIFPALGWLLIAFRLWQLLWAADPIYAVVAIIACVYCSISFLGKAVGASGADA